MLHVSGQASLMPRLVLLLMGTLLRLSRGMTTNGATGKALTTLEKYGDKILFVAKDGSVSMGPTEPITFYSNYLHICKTNLKCT